MYLSGPPRGRGAMSRSGGSLRGPSPSRGRSKGRGGSGRDDDRGFRGPPLAGAFARLALCDVTNPCPRVSLPPPPPHFLAEEWIARLEEGRCCCGNRANRRAGLVQVLLCVTLRLFLVSAPPLSVASSLERAVTSSATRGPPPVRFANRPAPQHQPRQPPESTQHNSLSQAP
jgi:hypothetical protein